MISRSYITLVFAFLLNMQYLCYGCDNCNDQEECKGENCNNEKPFKYATDTSLEHLVAAPSSKSLEALPKIDNTASMSSENVNEDRQNPLRNLRGKQSKYEEEDDDDMIEENTSTASDIDSEKKTNEDVEPVNLINKYFGVRNPDKIETVGKVINKDLNKSSKTATYMKGLLNEKTGGKEKGKEYMSSEAVYKNLTLDESRPIVVAVGVPKETFNNTKDKLKTEETPTKVIDNIEDEVDEKEKDSIGIIDDEEEESKKDTKRSSKSSDDEEEESKKDTKRSSKSSDDEEEESKKESRTHNESKEESKSRKSRTLLSEQDEEEDDTTHSKKTKRPGRVDTSKFENPDAGKGLSDIGHFDDEDDNKSESGDSDDDIQLADDNDSEDSETGVHKKKQTKESKKTTKESEEFVPAKDLKDCNKRLKDALELNEMLKAHHNNYE
ncbi:hypothetical protein BdWA1_000178 [Babesia duncani]|uniref:Uncharacterized protein n=1 Tax=Babesia duncani TaxID=323732 RepID=A0AAD9PLX1_9APIC|nr:hypothetical protein BdWA1_000178 [Babesia duncani]